MSFVSALKTITNKINSMAKAMDSKVDTFSDSVLSLIEETNSEFFDETDREEFKNKIKSLFSMFDQEDKKPKKINGYILFSQENRETCGVNNPGITPTELTKKLGAEWQNLNSEEKQSYTERAKDVKPQTKEEKKAKRAASKSPLAKPAPVVEPVAKVVEKEKSPRVAALEKILSVKEKKSPISKAKSSLSKKPEPVKEPSVKKTVEKQVKKTVEKKPVKITEGAVNKNKEDIQYDSFFESSLDFDDF